MSQYPAWLAGMIITDARLNAMSPNTLYQGSDLTRTSSTVLTNTDLVIPGLAGATYEYEIDGRYSSSAVAIKTNWSLPSGAVRNGWGIGGGSGATGAPADATTLNHSFAITASFVFAVAAATANGFVERGYIVMSSTPGNCVFQFAQNVSNAASAILYTTSRMRYRQIS